MPFWTSFELAIEAFFIVILGVIVFCAAHEKQRKNRKIPSAFFPFYIVQSIIDVVLMKK